MPQEIVELLTPPPYHLLNTGHLVDTWVSMFGLEALTFYPQSPPKPMAKRFRTLGDTDITNPESESHDSSP